MKKDAKKLITIKKLSKVSGIKLKTLISYVRHKILPYIEQDEKFNRYYDQNKSLKRLKEIKRLKEEGANLTEIKNYFNKQDYDKELNKIVIVKRKPSVIFKYTQRIKKKIEKILYKRRRQGISEPMEVIIRDIARPDLYPDFDYSLPGPHPYFKTELKGIYYNGIEIFIGLYKNIVFNKKTQKWRRARIVEKNKITCITVGRIPFENIIEIDWAGDEYYPIPHIYCDYKNGSLYEKTELYGRREEEKERNYIPIDILRPI